MKFRARSGGAYTVYGGGGTLTGTTIEQPGTFSKTCLSWHGGTIGLGTVGKNGVSKTFPMTTTLNGGLTGNGSFQAINIEANGYSPYIGTDLQNDHPVGFEFPVAGYGVGGGVPGISITVDDSGFIGLSRLTGAGTGAVYPVFQYAAGATTLDVFECCYLSRSSSGRYRYNTDKVPQRRECDPLPGLSRGTAWTAVLGENAPRAAADGTVTWTLPALSTSWARPAAAGPSP